MIWRTPHHAFDLRSRGLIMGILNVTPDSFSDGGEHASTTAAVAHGLRMVAEGADILDIGGESTRPGADPVPEGEEMRRVLPVIEKLRAQTGVVLSIDTSKATVARAALAAGAEILNDITALAGDPAMAALAAETQAGVILMHSRGTPRTMQQNTDYQDVVAEVNAWLGERLRRACAAGIAADRVALDPGLCFAKTAEQNWQLVESLATFTAHGRPVVLGASRKSFLRMKVGEDRNLRDALTARLTAQAFAQGVRIFRVHVIPPNRVALPPPSATPAV